MNKRIRYMAIRNAVDMLCILLDANAHEVIDILTGYLWSEEEAGELKQ